MAPDPSVVDDPRSALRISIRAFEGIRDVLAAPGRRLVLLRSAEPLLMLADSGVALRQGTPGAHAVRYTKFLYFASKSVRSAAGPQPLILDQVLAQRIRSLAQAVSRETGHDPDGSIARWVWRDTNWSPHRYAVYLSFMQAASRQASETPSWPSDATPDRLGYALFSTSWT
ncbi:hypothetical protein AB0D65_15865 [Streptomyces griseoloalbus]|uniref:Uncharacterized protein n=1 Tax=Streptomyces griseoloalbus TaxID=67303 RepID=A0ABV3E5K7_9ACTN